MTTQLSLACYFTKRCLCKTVILVLLHHYYVKSNHMQQQPVIGRFSKSHECYVPIIKAFLRTSSRLSRAALLRASFLKLSTTLPHFPRSIEQLSTHGGSSSA